MASGPNPDPNPDPSPVVEVAGLTKRYKELTALSGVSFQVREGEILGLLGPNGSGKSTTINCILSLLTFDEGEIRIFREPMHPDAVAIKSQIGVVFQDVAVFDELSVYENIDYFCGLYIRDRALRKQYVADAIDLVSLQDFVKFRPKKLSGGLLRRLNIACGIAHKPKLIILDEPTVAVDPQSRNNILDGIRRLNREGATVIYTTHYMEEVELICNRIIILDHGEIIAEGSAESLKQDLPLSAHVTVEVDSPDESLRSALADLPNAVTAEIVEHEVVVGFRGQEEHLITVVDLLRERGVESRRISQSEPTLNDVFLELTGKALRD